MHLNNVWQEAVRRCISSQIFLKKEEKTMSVLNRCVDKNHKTPRGPSGFYRAYLTDIDLDESTGEIWSLDLDTSLRFLKTYYLENRTLAKDFQDFLKDENGLIFYQGSRIDADVLINICREQGLLTIPFQLAHIKDLASGLKYWNFYPDSSFFLKEGQIVLKSFSFEKESWDQALKEKNQIICENLVRSLPKDL